MNIVDENTKQHLRRIAHRLNGKLSLIRQYLIIISEDHGNILDSSPDLKTCFSSLQNLTQDTLDIVESLAEVHEPKFNLQPISLETIFAEIRDKFEVPSSIHIVLPKLLDVVNVWATEEIHDVVSNLVTNAFEAMPKGGTLEIDVEVSHSLQQVKISFADTGVGMPEYVKNSLFSAYFTTKSNSGHGLGLYWARYYMDSIGGKIVLESSTVGQGTVFVLYLPLISIL